MTTLTEILLNRGQCYQKMGRYEDAFEDFSLAIFGDSDDPSEKSKNVKAVECLKNLKTEMSKKGLATGHLSFGVFLK